VRASRRRGRGGAGRRLEGESPLRLALLLGGRGGDAAPESAPTAAPAAAPVTANSEATPTAPSTMPKTMSARTRKVGSTGAPKLPPASSTPA